MQLLFSRKSAPDILPRDAHCRNMDQLPLAPGAQADQIQYSLVVDPFQNIVRRKMLDTRRTVDDLLKIILPQRRHAVRVRDVPLEDKDPVAEKLLIRIAEIVDQHTL